MFQATKMIRLGTSARTTVVATTTRAAAASLSTTSAIRQLESTPTRAPSDTTPPPSSPATPEASSSSSKTTELPEPKPQSKPTWTRPSSKPSRTTAAPPPELPSYPALDALSAFSPIPVLNSSTHCATLTLRSYTPSLHHLTFYTQFVLRSARALGLRTSGPHPLPIKTQLITVPRSPFAHKKSQQNFWRRTHARTVDVYDANEHVLEMWLAYLRKEAMGGVGVKVQSFTRRELGWASGVSGARREGTKGGKGRKGTELGQEGMDEEVERLAKELEGEIKLGLKLEQEQEQEEQVKAEDVRDPERTEAGAGAEAGKQEETK